MRTVTASTDIDATPTQVWAIVGDLTHIQRHHPDVETASYLSEASQGMDAARICHFGSGRSMEEHAIAWTDGEGYVLELRNVRGFPMETGQVAVNLRPIAGDAAGPSATRLTLTLSYSLKGVWRWFGFLADVRMGATARAIVDNVAKEATGEQDET